MFPLPYGETVTRLRGVPVSDRFSNESTALDWSTPAQLAVKGCAFDPAASTEPLEQARNGVLSKPTIYAPAGSDITAHDRLVVRGRTWQVDGDPADYRSPFTGWAAGLVVRLKAMEG